MFSFRNKIDFENRDFYISIFCAIFVKIMYWVNFYVLHKLPSDSMFWIYIIGTQLVVYLLLRIFVKREYISLYIAACVILSVISSVSMTFMSSNGMAAALSIVFGVYELGSILPTISVRIIENALINCYYEYKSKKEDNNRLKAPMFYVIGIVAISKILYWCIAHMFFALDIAEESIWIYFLDLLIQVFVFFFVNKKVRVHMKSFLRLDFGLGVLAMLIYSVCNPDEGGTFFGILDACAFFHVFLLAYIYLLKSKTQRAKRQSRVDTFLFIICIIALCGLILYDIMFFYEMIVDYF